MNHAMFDHAFQLKIAPRNSLGSMLLVVVMAASTTLSKAQDTLVISVDVENATLSAPGSIDLQVTGAEGSVRIVTTDTLPDSTAYGTLLTTIDTTGFHAIGLPAFAPIDVGYQQYLEMLEPKLDSLLPGKYQLIVLDEAGNQGSAEVEVGRNLTQSTLQGAVMPNEGSVTKTAGDGWTNMRYSTKNILLDQQDGWIVFNAPDTEGRSAVGLRDESIGSATSYQQMEFAWVLDGDSAATWESGVFAGEKVAFVAGSKFSIEVKKGVVLFALDGKEVRASSPPTFPEAMIADVAIYDTNGKVESLKTDFPAQCTIIPTVGHIKPLFPGSGRIELTVEPNKGDFTYEWADGPSTPERDELGPGTYTVEVHSTYYQTAQIVTFDVGNLIVWENDPYDWTTDPLGLTKLPLGSEGGSEGAMSMNMGTAQEDHYLRYTPQLEGADGNDQVVGWKSRTTGRILASWWLHPLGSEMIAEAVAASGVIARTVVREGDELSIENREGIANFKINQKVIGSGSIASEQGAFGLFVRDRSGKASLNGLRTSLAVPIKINTRMLAANVPYSARTPDEIFTAGASGSQLDMDLGYGPLSGDHVLDIPATASSRSCTVRFELDSGHVEHMRIVEGQDTYTVDASLFSVVGVNELVLYDQPESYFEEVAPPFHLDLQDQVLMTPNGDNANDVFRVLGLVGMPQYGLTITDRDANILFQSEDPSSSWNGRFMNTGSAAVDGVYRYEIMLDGVAHNGQFLLKN